MRKLYFQIYMGVVSSLALLVVLGGMFWHFQGASSPQNQVFQTVRDVIMMALPAADAPEAEQQAVLEKLARPALPRISLYSANLRLLASAGPVLMPPPPDMRDTDWLWRQGGQSAWVMHLPDGRWLLAQAEHDRSHTPLPFIVALALIALVVAVVAYPMTRRMTRRLENLKKAVESLGAGDFKTRVDTRGCDEVSSLANSFNSAVERIESLLSAHKQLLANASHELRSPLTRLRLGLEMHAEQPDPKQLTQMRQDIAELEMLIEEILLASRLDAMREPLHMESVDLAALLAEESARCNAQCDATPVTITGDARLLRRLLRNLLDNARKHGGGDIHTNLSVSGTTVTIQVCDNGNGVAPEERERIFEPFYRPAGTREREGSYGLGLSLVRQIAERHGGSVTCVAGREKGSCFEVILPNK
jgi:signal transduction histidine kinase